MSTTGVLKSMFAEKGFGFVTPDDGGDDCFVHVKDNPELDGVDQGGDAVTFDKEWDDRKGKYKGVNCTLTGGGGGGGGNGGGKGGKGAAKQVDKFKEKLSKIDSSMKVWVGGLSKKVTWKELEKHFTQINKPAVTDVNERKGTGVVAFKNEDDVSSAISSLNGSELCGSAIEVDVWTKPERKTKEEGEEGETKEKRHKKKQTVKTKFGQASGIDPKTKEKLDKIDASLKVFIGGLPKGVAWKELEKHVASLGTKPAVTDVREKSGRACLAYKEEADVANAIASLNGTEFKGKTIEADVWTKPEKKA